MELRHLRYFVAAVEEGSLQGAASRMNVAQPALSRRIRDLEIRTGCDLLIRGARGVTPTRAGASLYRDALKLLEGLDEARHRARRLGQEAPDVPRFGVIVTARKLPFLHETMRTYKETQPGAPVTFMRDLSPDLANALRERRLDISLLYEWRLGMPGTQERLIHYEQYVLAAHPDNRLARSREPIRLAELAEDPLVWLARGEMSDRSDPLMRQCLMRGLDPVVSHIARTHDEQIDVTIVSGGACITPASLLLDIHRDFLAVRPLADVDMEISLSLAWTTEMLGAPAQALLAILHDAIDRHQDQILSGAAPWAVLHSQPVIRVPQDARGRGARG
ncbi:MAG: LysR family transcriptional regulator [Rhizobiaceae bacterium]|nr:LysR family transcriptional regulator [Rhizobiaceae bacterium]